MADFGLSACCGGFSATGNENMDTRKNGSNGEGVSAKRLLMLRLVVVFEVLLWVL